MPKLKIVETFSKKPGIVDLDEIEQKKEPKSQTTTKKKQNEWTIFLKKFREENKGKYKPSEYFKIASAEYKKLKLQTAPPEFKMPKYKKYIQSILTNTNFDFSKHTRKIQIEAGPPDPATWDPFAELIRTARWQGEPQENYERRITSYR